jgi:tetratricopeptide (TPR) repeat protein
MLDWPVRFAMMARMRKTLGPLAAIIAVTALAARAAAQSYSVEGANRYVAARDWNDLLRYAEEWTRSEPSNAIAWYYLGNTYGFGLKRNADAARAFQRCVALRPDWASAYNALGVVSVLNRQYAQGASAFERAVQLSPQSPVYWNNLAAAYSDLGQFDREREVLAHGVEASGRFATAHNWYVFGNAYHRLHEERRAVEAYSRALAMNPNLAEAYNNRGAAYQLLGNYSAAVADYQRAAQLGDNLSGGNLRTLKQATSGGGGMSAGSAASAAIQLNNGIRDQQVITYMSNHPGVTHHDAYEAVGQGEL